MRRALLAVLVVGLPLTGCALLPAADRPSAADPAPAQAGVPVPDGAQEAVVVRLVDGDTVVLRGRGTGPLPPEPTRVRLLLVDTPEVHGGSECFGERASQRAGELLPDGATVRVQRDEDPEDRFDRALLHVWDAAGVNVGEALVREGYAQVLVVRPNELHLAAFERAEAEARDADLGLWAACGS